MPQGGPKPSRFYVERQALTRSPTTPTAPSDRSSEYSSGQLDPGEGTPRPGDGILLSNLNALSVSLYPWEGHTLSGSGSLLCWIYNPFEQKWTRCPDLDFALVTASIPAQTFASLHNISRLGSLLNYATSSVTVSGGTDVLLRIDGFQSSSMMAV